MKRPIVTIDEALCDGCGDCVTACSEGALRIVDGKAKLVREIFCDGFGDCIGECPTGALIIEEREAEPFDVASTRQFLLKTQGAEAVRNMEDALRRHRKPVFSQGVSGRCPGSAVRTVNAGNGEQPVAAGQLPKVHYPELRQWPVQLHLVQPGAPFFAHKELVVMNTCGPLASADVHWRYLRGRSVVVGCPKLDDTRNYAAKLGMILREPTIPKVIVVRMEVPCCGGLTRITEEAVRLSGRHDLVLQEDIIGVSGEIHAEAEAARV